MKLRSTVLLMLLVLESACAIRVYRPTEPVKKPPETQIHDKIEFLSFSYTPCLAKIMDKELPCDSRWLEKLPWEYQSVKDLLERHSRFIKVIVTSAPQAQGTHIVVYQTQEAPLSRWCKLSEWSLSIIPCYTDSIVSKVHFDLYVDSIPKQSYSYDIRFKAIYWIGLLPFTWIEFFTTQYTDAFSANTYQFIEDARQDGFL